MTLRFNYKLVSCNYPVLPLGGRHVRPRPIITVTVIGPTGTWVMDGSLDSSSDDTVFPEMAALRIGLDLTNAPTGTCAGVGSGPIPVRYGQVLIRITDGQERREWPAMVAFTTVRLHRALLGFAGFLQFFTSKFHGDHELAELTVNSLYPGT